MFLLELTRFDRLTLGMLFGEFQYWLLWLDGASFLISHAWNFIHVHASSAAVVVAT